MSSVFRRCSLAALAALGLSLPVLEAEAHHSPAMFDLSQDLTLEGTVTEFSWRNPHVYIELELADPEGRPVTRRIEAGPASNFVTLGVNADSVRVGDHVVVEVKPNRAGQDRVALGWRLTKADGTVIPLHVRAIPPAASGAATAAGLAGTWVPRGTDFARLAAGARAWPLTERGRAAVESTRAARDASRSRCVPFGPPALMALPSTVIVEAGESEVRFRLDVMNAERVVHLDEARQPDGLAPTLAGHSIGHFEGGTLVVDTVGYAAHPDGYAFDLPSSASKHVVERFGLSADRKHLEYEAVVEDPEYLAEPVTHKSLWDYRPGQQPSNVPCDPAAASRFLTEE